MSWPSAERSVDCMPYRLAKGVPVEQGLVGNNGRENARAETLW